MANTTATLLTCQSHCALALCVAVASCSGGANTKAKDQNDSVGTAARTSTTDDAGYGGTNSHAGSGRGMDSAVSAGGSGGMGAAGAAQEGDAVRCGSDLQRIQSFDPQRAARGEALFESGTLTPGVVPEVVLRNLWVAWGI